MDLQNYLIDHAKLDWPSIREWNWLLPQFYRVCLLTRAGDIFIETPGGSVQMLDVGSGELRIAAGIRQ